MRMAVVAVMLSMALPPAALRVCADPDNLPYTNRAGRGFENRIADLLARDLGARVEYTWWPQQRGFIRNTLNANACDVVLGYPSAADNVLTTTPYYRSTYVFVTRQQQHLAIGSLDDPRLRRLRIGVPLIGDDGANAPPAHALGRRGIIANVKGYPVFGDGRRSMPALIAAVAGGDVDVAAMWGPLAGYFAPRAGVALELTPVVPQVEGTLPQVFDISMAVRRGDVARKRQLDAFIERRRTDIQKVLAAYGVPIARGTP